MAERATSASAILIALACAVLLAGVHGLTAERIRHNETGAARTRLLALVPDHALASGWLPDVSRHPARWILLDGTELARSDVAGYGGPIQLLYRLERPTDSTAPARLLGLTVLRHAETPGITDFLGETNGWLGDLSGRTGADLAEVTTISGATITTRALRDHLSRTLRDPDATLGVVRSSEARH
jgi:Na+-translocating ferredoxin:NAD+ oxidoreductase RnfG subunit